MYRILSTLIAGLLLSGCSDTASTSGDGDTSSPGGILASGVNVSNCATEPISIWRRESLSTADYAYAGNLPAYVYAPGNPKCPHSGQQEVFVPLETGTWDVVAARQVGTQQCQINAPGSPNCHTKVQAFTYDASKPAYAWTVH